MARRWGGGGGRGRLQLAGPSPFVYRRRFAPRGISAKGAGWKPVAELLAPTGRRSRKRRRVRAPHARSCRTTGRRARRRCSRRCSGRRRPRRRASPRSGAQHPRSRAAEVLGGSADLTGSNNTLFKARAHPPAQAAGDYLHYGVREFGMTAIMNGISLHVASSSTRHVPGVLRLRAQRRAARLPDEPAFILVYTHDSIGLGEDGPTHQPIEHLSSLRAMPHMNLWRPCDAAETVVAWSSPSSAGADGAGAHPPAAAAAARTPAQLANIRRGGYVCSIAADAGCW